MRISKLRLVGDDPSCLASLILAIDPVLFNEGFVFVKEADLPCGMAAKAIISEDRSQPAVRIRRMRCGDALVFPARSGTTVLCLDQNDLDRRIGRFDVIRRGQTGKTTSNNDHVAHERSGESRLTLRLFLDPVARSKR